jgi:hypothetical protein
MGAASVSWITVLSRMVDGVNPFGGGTPSTVRSLRMPGRQGVPDPARSVWSISSTLSSQKPELTRTNWFCLGAYPA